MNLKEAEALVEKNLPIWNSIASSNFAGFAELLVEDYKDWAHDTLESIMDSSMTEDEFDRTLEAWERPLSHGHVPTRTVIQDGGRRDVLYRRSGVLQGRQSSRGNRRLRGRRSCLCWQW